MVGLTKQAGLTHVLELSTGLTHFCSLVSHLPTRTPAEHSVGSSTHLGSCTLKTCFPISNLSKVVVQVCVFQNFACCISIDK